MNFLLLLPTALHNLINWYWEVLIFVKAPALKYWKLIFSATPGSNPFSIFSLKWSPPTKPHYNQTIPILYTINSTALWDKTSHHQSFLETLPDCYSTSCWNLQSFFFKKITALGFSAVSWEIFLNSKKNCTLSKFTYFNVYKL